MSKKIEYNSTLDTMKHKERVSELISLCITELLRRGINHDNSKLNEPEKSYFDKYNPKLKDITYGSTEYKECLGKMRPAIDHHNKHNRHHPEHFKDGIMGMNLFDLIEMICDWKAVGERHNEETDIESSILINQTRFDITAQLTCILLNTARYIKMLSKPEDMLYAGD